MNPRLSVVAAAIAVTLLASGCGPTRAFREMEAAPGHTIAREVNLDGSAMGEHVTVARVIDGDTVELTDGRKIGVTGIDTPERGQCGYKEAKAWLQSLSDAYGGKFALNQTQDKPDRYGRVIGYLEWDEGDVGLDLLQLGLAKARYDGLDGYPSHERQDAYRAADAANPDLCPKK